jgi:hypothetical protein
MCSWKSRRSSQAVDDRLKASRQCRTTVHVLYAAIAVEPLTMRLI